MRTTSLVVLAAAAGLATIACAVSSPRPAPTATATVARRDDGQIVRAIRVEGADQDAILPGLRTRVGQPLRAVDVAVDMQTLWQRQRCIVAAVRTEDTGNGVLVTLAVTGAAQPPR